jgi:hypothetical protein
MSRRERLCAIRARVGGGIYGLSRPRGPSDVTAWNQRPPAGTLDAPTTKI